MNRISQYYSYGAVLSLSFLTALTLSLSVQASRINGLRYQKIAVFADPTVTAPAPTGNPTPVVLNARNLSLSDLQLVAARLALETGFIMSETPISGSWPVRVFQANGAELAFSGSAALALATEIRAKYYQNKANAITLNWNGTGGIGLITITFEGAQSVPYFTTGPATFGRVFSSTAEVQAVADTLFNDENASARLAKIDTGFPIQSINAGLPWIVVPVTSLAAIQSAVLDPGKEIAFQTNLSVSPFALFMLVTRDTLSTSNCLHVRAFAGVFGFEDVATGSGGSDVAAWAAQNEYLDSNVVNCAAEQGSELGIPSLVYYQATSNAGVVASTKIGGISALVGGLQKIP